MYLHKENEDILGEMCPRRVLWDYWMRSLTAGPGGPIGPAPPFNPTGP